MAERALSASVLAAIASGSLRPFLLYEGEYVSGGAAAFLRLWTGVGTLAWDGKSWAGGGELLSISPIRESTSLEAIGFSVRVSGMPADKLSLFLQSMRRNRPGKLWMGFVGDEVVESGTAQAGSADTLTLAAGASSEVNAHARRTLRLTGGAGSVQERPVSAYDGGTKVATVSPRWQPNKMLQSENFEVSPWTGTVPNHGSGLGSSRENVASPVHDGVACLVTTTDDLSGGIRQSVSCASSTEHVWSFYIEKGTCTSVRFQLENGGLAYGQPRAALLNLETGALSSVTPSGWIDAVAEGDGWRVTGRLGLSRASAGAAAHCEIEVVNEADFGKSFIYAQPQVEEGTAGPVDYTATVAAAITLPDATTGYEVIDPNGVIADPYPVRRGRFDMAPISRDAGSGTMTIEARYEGPLARLLVPNVRHYTHEDQQLRLAGDKGFDQVEELQDTQDIWGPEVPAFPKTSRTPKPDPSTQLA